MAFMGTMEKPCNDILVYSLEYELIERIKLDSLIMISSMTLSPDEKYLICAHLQIKVTIINTTDFKVITDSPFGDQSFSVWRVAVTNSGRIIFATSDGLYTGRITEDGEFDGENHLHEGCNVERAQVVIGEFVMCAVKESESSKLILIDLD